VSSDFPHLVAAATDWHLLKQTCKIFQRHHCRFFFLFFPLLLLHLRGLYRADFSAVEGD
jgi:hypothetical protein